MALYHFGSDFCSGRSALGFKILDQSYIVSFGQPIAMGVFNNDLISTFGFFGGIPLVPTFRTR